MPLWRSVGRALLLLPVLTLAFGCAHTIVADYVFRVEGIVLDAAGNPISGVRVSLELVKPVYQTITPVTHADLYTNEQGRFGFGCLSHDSDPPYTLSFEKQGYQSVSIEGAIQVMNPHSVKMVAVAK